MATDAVDSDGVHEDCEAIFREMKTRVDLAREELDRHFKDLPWRSKLRSISAEVVASYIATHIQEVLQFWAQIPASVNWSSQSEGSITIPDCYIVGRLVVNLEEIIGAAITELIKSPVRGYRLDSIERLDEFFIEFRGVEFGSSLSLLGSHAGKWQLVCDPVAQLDVFVILRNCTGSGIDWVGGQTCMASIVGCTFGLFRVKNASFRLLSIESSSLKKLEVEGNREIFPKLESIQLQDGASIEALSFERVHIGYGISFGDSKISKSIEFTGCRLECPPDFHGTELPSNTVFFNNEFVFRIGGLGQREALRALRVKMRKIGARESEALFFSQEQRIHRRLLKNRGEIVEWVISWLYDVVSVYGTSPGRALGCFIGWNLLFLAVLWAMLQPCFVAAMCLVPEGAVKFSPSSEYSQAELPVMLLTQNLLNPTALFTDKALVRVNSGIVALLCVIHTLGAFGILTLLLLSIRSMFQRSGGGSDS